MHLISLLFIFLILWQLSILLYPHNDLFFFPFAFSDTDLQAIISRQVANSFFGFASFIDLSLFFFLFSNTKFCFNDKKSCILHNRVNASYPRFHKDTEGLVGGVLRPILIKEHIFSEAVAVITTVARAVK